MKALFTWLLVIMYALISNANMYDMVSCYVCENIPLEGKVQDCSCGFSSVNAAVETFFQPILYNITHTTFFKYFQVDMETPCSFWKEDGMCMMEGCSICTCSETEIPQSWLQESAKKDKEAEYGWISPMQNGYGNNAVNGEDDALGRMQYSARSSNDWIQGKDGETYANLLLNPERYTGYSGPAASRVWRAIQQENCFGGQDDTCLEKRVFYRLMSGLQASISTHIAVDYYYAAENRWGANLPLFIRAVGAHPDRLNNLYFAFLFALRAAHKARDLLLAFPIDSGNSSDDVLASDLIREMLSSPLASTNVSSSISLDARMGSDDVEQCRTGFDESQLFQVYSIYTDI